jgi:Na+-translocating ferredoxin:NAD+ oxidoreductase RnfC subunit
MAQSPQGQAAPPPPPLRGDPVPGGGKPGLPIPFEPVLTAATGDPNSLKIENYINRGGYTALRKVAESMTPDEVIKDVGDSKLVGRGGAGFPTGVKWGGTRRNPGPRYLVVNADESEPGTFGNRYAIEGDPHMLIEGMLICCFAVDRTVAAPKSSSNASSRRMPAGFSARTSLAKRAST